ncbi:MAG TPA: lectin, partial [Streptosporangiaceae bacterium]|nr:lectin [Streptosporangiaceae bacterium]
AFCGAGNTYTLYFDMKFNHAFTGNGTFTPVLHRGARHLLVKPAGHSASIKTASARTPERPNHPVLHGLTGHSAHPKVTGPNGAYLTFNTTTNKTVLAKVGVSYVSQANAALNLSKEQPGFHFSTVKTAAQSAWNSLLGRIQVTGGTSDQQTEFYTAIYHASLHPNINSDDNGQYMGVDGNVHMVDPGHSAEYTNFSGWDIYRSQAQLEALLDPAAASDTAQSMVDDYAQDGMFPKWMEDNGESYVMVGDPADSILADYYAFGATNFDTATALTDMVGEATNKNNVRPGLNYLKSIGYVPADASTGCCNFYGPTSTTLEYNTADLALSAFAGALGDTSDQKTFQSRAQDWQNVFNPATGFMEGRNSDGSWEPGFNPHSGGDPNFVEATPYIYTGMVPFNLAGLTSAMGGDARMNGYLNKVLSNFAGNNGYAWMGNEPSIELPWEYDYTGKPYQTQGTVRKIQDQIWADTPGGLGGGNDDLGTMSAWFVWSALGMYPETPGTSDLALGSPMFTQAVITLGNGKTLTINGNGAADNAPYVQSATWNGAAWNNAYAPTTATTSGGTLTYTLGTTPNTSWASAPSAAPPSYTTGESPVIGWLSNGMVTLAPGGTAKVTVSAQNLAGVSQTVNTSVSAPAGVTITPSSGTISVPAGGRGSLTLTVSAASSTAQNFYTAPIKLTDGSVSLPTQTLTVRVAQPGTMLAAYNDPGISNDSAVGPGNFDGGGFSYSEQALAAAGVTAGNPVSSGGITYTWPVVASGFPDNVMAAGQRINVNAPAGTQQIGFLGSATNGPGEGEATLTYSGGTKSTYWLGLSDWTLNAGQQQPSYGNLTAATTAYRNSSCCGRDTHKTYLFTTALPVDPSKTLTSVTLPANANGGTPHVFAIGTTTTASTGPVVTAVSPGNVSAGQQVTLTGSGFGATQGSGYVSLSDLGSTWGGTGSAGTVTVDSWSDTKVVFTMPSPTSTAQVWAGTAASVGIVNGSGGVSTAGVLTIPPTSSMTDYYDNIGISPDSNQVCANMDGDGYSLSADALTKAGAPSGGTVTSRGVTFTWPTDTSCTPDDVLAAGQTILLPAHTGAKVVGFLGTSTNGSTAGRVIIHYTDGSSATASLVYGDWAGGAMGGDHTALTTAYRNSIGGTSQQLTVRVFEANVKVNPAKTVASVTLPFVAFQVTSSNAAMHIFAIGQG